MATATTSNNSELRIVDDVWHDFLNEFESGELLHDQILIVTEELYLRCPNFDLLVQVNLENFIH